MNKKQAKRQRDIKAKLMAAICMLLVSSIMMVSTTYAWFTLSTAPEVKGISTAVGANGNLEMALQPLDGDVSKITAAAGDSMTNKTVFAANTTWGNLVDVSDNDSYGLDKITLYPAKLNSQPVNSDGKQVEQIQLNPLSTPVYGADGRISELASNSVTGTMDSQRDAFYEGTAAVPGYGVRAIGTVSSMTPRNLAYRQALADASSHGSQAKSVASSSLNTNGSTLADVAVNHALFSPTTENPTETYTKTQVAAMENVVTGLLGDGTAANPGALGHIELALKNYIVAYTIREKATEDTFATLKENITKATLADLADGKVSGAVLPTGFVAGADAEDNGEGKAAGDGYDDGYIGKLRKAIASATTAKTTLDDLEDKATYTWDEISPALKPLVDTDGLLINDMELDYVMQNKGELAGSVMANGLILTLGTGAGVYADIADFCGNYSAGIVISKLAYGEIKVENVKATMNTATTVNPVYLTAASQTVSAKEFESAGGGTGATPMTDFYGYIIDLAFRTNAADSYLQLQAEATDRIYGEEGKNTNTQGGGANMTFESLSTTFDAASIKSLMQAVRIVFFDTIEKNVVAYARLDSASTTTDEGKYIMPLYMCNADGTKKTDDTTTNGVKEDIAIMALEQNTIHKLSVLVYLDGEVVGNDDVAADAVKSLTGSMNLQFSSSANLDAMDYSNLMAGDGGALDGASESKPTTPTPTIVDVDDENVTVTDGYTATVKHITSGNVKALVAEIKADGTALDSTFTGTVTIGGQPASYQTVGTLSGWAVIGVDAPTGAVAVAVTAPSTGE